MVQSHTSRHVCSPERCWKCRQDFAVMHICCPRHDCVVWVKDCTLNMFVVCLRNLWDLSHGQRSMRTHERLCNWPPNPSGKWDAFAGRVHPGESNSSWIMRGLLDTLTGPSPAAQALRDKYLFMVMRCTAQQQCHNTHIGP